MAKKTANDVLSRLKSFYEFMTQHSLEALELDEGGLRLKMLRRRAPTPAAVPVPVYMNAPAPSAAPSSDAAQNSGAVTTALPPGASAIKSTMMGIFYRASSPSSPPFVKEGETVKAGQVICMIEAMKVFNEIKADFPCTILKTLLDNGKPVKAGQDIFLIQR